jgi:hypothetical protein
MIVPTIVYGMISMGVDAFGKENTMEFKHLRGKHDQKDHGRRQMGSGGSLRAIARAGAGTVETAAQNPRFQRGVDNARRHLNYTQSEEFPFQTPRRRGEYLKEKIQESKGRISAIERERTKAQSDVRTKQRELAASKRDKSQSRNWAFYERQVQLAQGRVAEANNRIVEESGQLETFRQAYNDVIKTDKEQRSTREKERRQRAKAGTTFSVPVDTVTPFESLDDVGLLGWQRQRSVAPPDYTAFDQSTPGRPASVDFPFWGETSSWGTSGKPRQYRDVTQTPEGAPVRVVMPESVTRRSGMPDNPGLRDANVDDIAEFIQNARPMSRNRVNPFDTSTPRRLDSRNVPPTITSEDTVQRKSSWTRGIQQVGEAIFGEQGSDNNAFWDRENPNGQYALTFGQRSGKGPEGQALPDKPRIRDYVARHVSATAQDNNGYLRGSGRQRIYRDREDAYMAEALSSMRQVPKERLNQSWVSQKRQEFQQIVDRRNDIKEEITAIDSGMRPISETILTRRSVSPEIYARMQSSLRPGDRFTDDGFTSVSIDPTQNLSAPNGSMVNVIVTQGTPTLWASGSGNPMTSNEAILGRGTTFEVVSADNERGWILRTVPSPSGYTPPPIPEYTSQDVLDFIAEAPPPRTPRAEGRSLGSIGPNLYRHEQISWEGRYQPNKWENLPRVPVWDDIIKEMP